MAEIVIDKPLRELSDLELRRAYAAATLSAADCRDPGDAHGWLATVAAIQEELDARRRADGPLTATEALAREGVKYDDQKARLDLIPPEAIFALGEILTYGAGKYTARNWEKGMRWGRVFAAAMRHLWAWWGGRGPTATSFLFGSADDDTKRSHLWHALCCVVFLVTYEERRIGTDDRHQGAPRGDTDGRQD